jgi:hypothetical protein
VRRQIRRAQLLQFFAKQPACLVGIERAHRPTIGGASLAYWVIRSG